MKPYYFSGRWGTDSRKNEAEETSSSSSSFGVFSRSQSNSEERFSINTRGRNDTRNYRRPPYHESGERYAVRQTGFRFLQDLLKNEDLEQVIFSLNNDKRGFKELLESREISNDMIVMLVKLQCRICDCTFPELKLALFEMTLRTSFIDNVVKFVSTVALQSDCEKKHNTLLWNGIDEFWRNLLKISVNYHDMIPTTSCEAVLNLLKAAKFSIPMIKINNEGVHISDEVKVEVDKIYELVESTSVEIEKKLKMERVRKKNGEQEPPNDFRDISIYPSPMEVTIPDASFLRPNVTKGPYQSVHHYLDVQFRLLREDFVAPLRKGICKYLGNPNGRLENLKIYNPIKFLVQETVTEQNCYRIQFDFSKTKRTYVYENSRRFMFGALLCFTHDNFKTLLFGKVVKRDVKDCLEKGQLIVGFNADVILPPNLLHLNYLMVESTVFFEPYYQVLNVLRNMRPEAFPMERYIIRVETETDPPEYLLEGEPQMFTIESETFSPLYWGERVFYGLNDTQSEAFRAALTKEFAIIQGPPGTGKTFLGLRIAHTLLENKSVWYTKTPILVICYTNHALDQFLEGLLPVTEEVVRVGGQSKNEKLDSFNIRHKRRRYANDAVYQRRNEVRDFLHKISTINSHLNVIASNSSVINFSAFEEVVPDFTDTWFGSANSDQIHMWLFGGFDVCRSRQRDITNVGNQANRDAAANNKEPKEGEQKKEEPIVGEPKEEEPIEGEETMGVDNDVIVDDIFDNIVVQDLDELVSVRTLKIKLNELYRILEEMNQRQILTYWEKLSKMQEEEMLNSEICRVVNELQYLKLRLNERRIHTNGLQPQFVDLVNPQRMTPNDRWQLYYHWLSLYVESLKVEKVESTRLFRREYAVYSEMMSMEDAQVMKESLVVGMTTTAAARLQSSLQVLKSPIVIVEEAAEVLEAHVISALTAHCKHLILIGDHQQLKPSAADFKIETKYRLGISLFERMVINNIQCHTLDVQHRMRPEISSLVRPAIYPVLKDHESTIDRPRIAGLDNCLYFIDHKEQEQLCRDNSKKNIHEAQFLIQFARHLILNGYKPQNITILAAYLGQMFEMQREKLKFRMQLQDVRIAVLDNYQGEESDIILLSLVRNNQDNKIGFLKSENRVSVALSRARNGFYIMGNMTMLCNNSEIWPKINETLKNQDAIGTHLALRCQVHTDKVTRVKTAEDFSKMPEGGCDRMCEAMLNCGHICKRLCHVEDREHQRFKCNETCERSLCEDTEHKCKKRCFEICGPCNYHVERTLNCGHTVFIHCHIDPAVHKCTALVEAKLPCNHISQKRCHEDVETAFCLHPCDTRVEPCGHACMRACHIRNDPDHLEYECRKQCEKPMKGCTMTEDEGHFCREFCFEECSLCEITILKKRTKCSHAFKVLCHVNVDDILCEKPCQRELPCGHKCKRKCDESCGNCMEEVSKEVPDCKHKIKIACFQEPDRKYCEKKCPRLLSCGHPCRNTCKEVCTEDCKVTVECAIPSPCGHTIKEIVCYRKDTADSAMLLEMCSEKCSFKLECGHQCGGSCGECAQGRAHQRCREKCGVLLVCGHDCPIPCREACKPCLRDCLYRCSHSVCKKKCGEPCTRCKEQCNRRCNHQQCRKKCWDYCDVDPCTKPCPKTLKCGHPCVGFCGDPCPVLCKICDREELTQIFLGNEDDEDAVYVMLVDCKHIFEAGDMQRWLEMDKDQIKPKVCPRCKTIIMKTDRYSEYIKGSIDDMTNVKMKYYGGQREIEDIRNRLLDDLYELNVQFFGGDRKTSVSRFGRVLIPSLPEDHSGLERFIHDLMNRLQPVSQPKSHRKAPRSQDDFRRQDINKTDLHAIESKIKLISVVAGVFKERSLTTIFPMSIHQLNFILKLLSRDENSITNQEVDDITLEIDRFVRFMQFEEIMSTGKSGYSHSKLKNDERVMSFKKLIEKPVRYDKQQDDVLKSELEKLEKIVGSVIKITDAERVLIVKALGLRKGHWFKCPNGHPYVITECGGAMQVSQCYECKAPIGGRNNRLLPGQEVATEMDGARHGAWSEAMNMKNFGR
ncbi:unnamed protein product [Phaedon cochleariae]|uniref:NF-X1-type domain-containing protein n=1 Tax=Phaedon cochleariae TaxID=80249 RepID=A0A9N9SJB7_PHACE|nr:unnamed protein product [Phaedon cochleariae]